MADDFVVYGEAGSSVAVEADLTLAGASYRVESAPAERLGSTPNPMAQAPSLVLPAGELMTESAAVLVWLADSFPEQPLAPPPKNPARPQFLRRMSFVSAAIYALYWIRDESSGVVADPNQQSTVRAQVAERNTACWRSMDCLGPPRAASGWRSGLHARPLCGGGLALDSATTGLLRGGATFGRGGEASGRRAKAAGALGGAVSLRCRRAVNVCE